MSNPMERGICAQVAIFMVMGVLAVTPTTNAFVCPNVTEVSPCDCHLDTSQDPILDCIGPDVSQGVLNRVLAAVRRENNGTLELYAFNIGYTNLTEVDLTPLEGGTFQDITFGFNSLLSRVIGPDLNSTDWNPIQTRELYYYYNNFQDEGLQTMLSYFSRTEISNFYLSGNKLTGSWGQEFLPGFSDLSNVETLYLDDNNIRALGGGQFRGMSRLYGISINDNGLEEIGEDAFVTDGEGVEGYYFSVLMDNNNLTDESFHISSGIATHNASLINLEDNQFRTVREDRFLSFLEAHPENVLLFRRNPIWCDPGMKWLKDRREEFELRVWDLNCVNDPGKTAFTSSLVDG